MKATTKAKAFGKYLKRFAVRIGYSENDVMIHERDGVPAVSMEIGSMTINGAGEVATEFGCLDAHIPGRYHGEPWSSYSIHFYDD